MKTEHEIDRYLDFVRERHDKTTASKSTDSRARRILKHAVPTRLRGTARVIVTDLRRPWEQRKAPDLLARDPLLLHIGCGGEHKDGWVNIDLAGDPVDLAWNLAHPLPFPDGCAQGVFSEHLLEHLPIEAGLALLTECRRVLAPGGVIRTGVPDAGRLLHSYVEGSGFIEETLPGRPTRLLAVSELFYWHRHVAMYDTETLRLVLEGAGFDEVTEMAFGETNLPRCADTERRRAETLYVEATA